MGPNDGSALFQRKSSSSFCPYRRASSAAARRRWAAGVRGAERWNECEKERGRGDSVCVPMCMQICVCEHVSVWLLGLLRACACVCAHVRACTCTCACVWPRKAVMRTRIMIVLLQGKIGLKQSQLDLNDSLECVKSLAEIQRKQSNWYLRIDKDFKNSVALDCMFSCESSRLDCSSARLLWLDPADASKRFHMRGRTEETEPIHTSGSSVPEKQSKEPSTAAKWF